jgi:hypothetical protein
MRHLLRSPRTRLYAAYTLVAMLVVGPLLRPGYILALDMVFTPHLRMPHAVNNSYLFYALLHLVNSVLPGQIIQKLLLLGLFVIAGISMHRLIQYIHDKPGELAAYAAGILYAVNPFTYDRLMAGQYVLLLGYALLPSFANALLRLVRLPSRRAGLVAGAWAAGISVLSIHALGLMIVMAAWASVLALLKMRSGDFVRRLSVAGAWGIGLFLVLSSYWLVPLALGKGSTAAQLAQFSAQDNTAFATVGEHAVGKLSNVVRLQGFWAEDQGQFKLPQDNITAWGLLVLVLWIVVVVGLAQAWRRGHRLVTAFASGCIVLGVVLGSGIGNGLLISHLPLFGGFREPEKFVALTALGYSVGFGFGVAGLVRRLFAERSLGAAWVTTGAALLFPFIMTSTLVWGANGQLSASQYPAGWVAANRLLNQDHTSFQTLFLPWHLYMDYGFAGRIVASPAPSFFDQPVIVSDNPEFDGAAAAQPTPTKQQLDKLLPHAAERTDLAARLSHLHIKYILVAHEDDYTDYAYVAGQPHLTRVYASDSIDVFRNDSWRQP